MFRSLAIVGILTILTLCGSHAVTAQTQPAAPTTSATVNHMPDAERDRLMKEAMDKARAEMEAKKEKERQAAAKAEEAEKKKHEANLARQAEQELVEKQKAEAARKKAEDEKREAAKTTPEPSAKTENMELKPLSTEKAEKPVDLDKVKTESAAKVKEAPLKTESAPAPKKAETKEKPVVAAAKSAEQESDTKKSPSPAVRKTETAAAEPKQHAEVKAAGDRDSDKVINFYDHKESARGDSDSKPTASRADSGTAVKGQVVGIMPAFDGSQRILVREDNGHMTQVLLDRGHSLPPPQSNVSVRGQVVSSSGSQKVLQASSFQIETPGAVRVSRSVPAPEYGAMPLFSPVMGPPIMGGMPPVPFARPMMHPHPIMF